MAEILCLGDFNTYGWDPASPLGQPYEKPWVTLLQERCGRECRNLGMPGRRIPADEVSLRTLSALLKREAETGTLLLMLGTNNCILPPCDGPERCAEKMEALLRFLRREHQGLQPVLLGLPPLALLGENGGSDVRTVNRLYAALAECCSLPFYDPLPLNLPLAFDGVHLTEEGHRMLAEGLWKSGVWRAAAQGTENLYE